MALHMGKYREFNLTQSNMILYKTLDLLTARDMAKSFSISQTRAYLTIRKAMSVRPSAVFIVHDKISGLKYTAITRKAASELL